MIMCDYIIQNGYWLSFSTLLITLTALICKLTFLFSSAAFVAQDLIFRTSFPYT